MLLVDFYKIPIGVSLGVVGGILILSVIASLLVQRKGKGSPLKTRKARVHDSGNRLYATRTPVFARIWVLILLIGAVLTIVKWDSIATGPTGDDAIAVIRVVQRDLAEAQSSYGKSHASILYGANAILDEGWSKLQEKRYAEAISAAQEARQLLSTLPR
jgi:hypothetical protein